MSKIIYVLDLLLALPTWFITLAMIKFLPKGHPFKRKFPLAEWATGRTELSMFYDYVIWVCTILFVEWALA